MCRLCMRIIFICFLILFLNQSVLFAAEDEGYFLSLKQKGQLISLGQIQDNEGVWYDIWISPGYVSPYTYAKKYFYETGSDFAEYFHAKKYIDLAKLSEDSYRFAFDACINHCIIKGIPTAWEDNFESASKRTAKRVFGWWFAYPWAFMESTVDNVVRIPLCLTGSVLGIGVGTVVSPVYYMTNSSVKGLWHLSVNTITLPVIAGTWNTIISPPLSLIGQKPSLERVDGFWVKALTNEQALNLEYSESPISRDDIVLLQQWGVILDTELKPYENEQIQLRKETETARKKIMDYQKEKELKIRGEESQHVNNLRKEPDKQQLLNSLSERGFTANRLRALRSDINKTLKESGNTNDGQINHLINLLIQYPPSLINEKDYRSKTDPFRRSVEIIKDVNVPNE
jgi:hypothetical protein